ncbi:MAG: hypothetical protein WCO81_13825 [Cyanobacteriota bacterium ELA615]|jgi:hypothetical protein
MGIDKKLAVVLWPLADYGFYAKQLNHLAQEVVFSRAAGFVMLLGKVEQVVK